MDMEIFSFSRLSLYESCPYRFYKKYVEGYEEPITYPLALGKGVHKGIEKKLNGRSDKEAITSAIIEAEFHPEVTKKELSYLIKNAPIHQIYPNKVEMYFKIPLSNEENSPYIQGYIDVVGENFIIDWKTNRVPYDVTENNQIGLYAWALKQLTGIDEVYGSLYFLRFKKESKFLYTVKEMEKARLWAYNLAKDIQSKLSLVKGMPELKDDLFPATPTNNCSHCTFALECFRKFSPVAKSINE